MSNKESDAFVELERKHCMALEKLAHFRAFASRTESILTSGMDQKDAIKTVLEEREELMRRVNNINARS